MGGGLEIRKISGTMGVGLAVTRVADVLLLLLTVGGKVVRYWKIGVSASMAESEKPWIFLY